jgi:hypothetical protein
MPTKHAYRHRIGALLGTIGRQGKGVVTGRIGPTAS